MLRRPVESADVYSLGVMLYELLVGSHPFFEGPDDEPSFDELSRRLREQEPPRPSSKVMGSGDAELLAARVRGTVPAALSRTLREELDWIVLRALEREPDRRYGSVLELAGDLRRHLQHLPVLAGPPDSIYRLRKFVRRNRWPVTGAAALALALVAAVAGTSVGMVRARRAETAAQAEAEVAEEVTRLLTDLFAADNPYQYGSERPTVEEILEAASQRLEEGKVRDPRVRRRLSRALADLALAHGHFDQARDLLERAAGDLSSRAADSNDSLEIRLKLATVDRQSGRLQEASDRLEELLPEARSRLGEKDPRLGLVLLELGLVQADLQRPRQSETWFRQALSVFRSSDAAPAELATSLSQLALVSDEPEECLELAEEALELRRQVLAPDHPNIAHSLGTVARCALRRGDYLTAYGFHKEAAETYERALGPDNPRTAVEKSWLANAAAALGRFVEARALVEAAIEAKDARYGAEHVQTAVSVNDTWLYFPGVVDRTGVRERLEQAVAVLMGELGVEHTWLWWVRHTLANVQEDVGMVVEARQGYESVLRWREEAGSPEYSILALLLLDLANLERRSGRLDRAEEYLARALILYDEGGQDPREHGRAQVAHATLLAAHGRVDEADQVFATAQDFYQRRTRGPRTYLDMRYDAAWWAVRGDRTRAAEAVRDLLEMGVHSDFLSRLPELRALFREQAPSPV